MGEKIKNILTIIYKEILDVIYPRKNECIICSREDAYGLCSKCRNNITRVLGEDLCIGYYKGVLKELILKFKYEQDFAAGEILVELIEEKLKGIDKEYIITYIPAGKKALKKRGYNQCEYIAKELSLITGNKVVKALKRIRETKVQKTLSREERFKNIKGAFQVIDKKIVENKKILLIDDVITTGATMDEAILTLKGSGAKEVKILTLAKSDI